MATPWWTNHPYGDPEQIAEEQAKDKARFCLATGVPPSEYDNLTQIEINAFIEEANKRAKRK